MPPSIPGPPSLHIVKPHKDNWCQKWSWLTYALALRLLFRTEYGDPGQKGANPPTIGSEQGYYQVSNVQIQTGWFVICEVNPPINDLWHCQLPPGRGRWWTTMGRSSSTSTSRYVILLHNLSVCFALISRSFEVHSKDTSSTFSKCFSRDCFKTRFSLLFLAIFLQLVQS